jgi:Peptidase family M23
MVEGAHKTGKPVGRVPRRRRWPFAALVAALVTAAGISSPSAGVAQTELEPQSTGLAGSVLTHPSAVRGTDGLLHIAYELVVTDATQFAADVERVDVRDARTERVLLTLSGDALSSRMNPVGGEPAGSAPEPSTMLASSGSAVIWLDVVVRRKADLPEVLDHRVESATRPAPGAQSIPFTSVVGQVPLARPPFKLGPPVRSSGIWGAGEGCCDNDTHHRRGLLVVDGNEVVPQRFAIDWMRLDEQHRAWVGDPHQLSSYLSYGQPLIAVAAGTVVVARDGFPDQPPPDNPTPPPFAELPGNRVVLRVAPGIYVLYAHMKPGSVRVSEGDRVRRGQRLGTLGNSGNSATPHLHLQLQTTRSFASDGLPFVFDRFRFLGRITSPDLSDEILGLRPNGLLPFAPATDPGTRRNQMPLDRSVVRFPKNP